MWDFVKYTFTFFGVELRASHLLDRCSPTGATPSTLSVLVLLRQGLHALVAILFVLPCIAGRTGAQHHAQPFVEMRSH
jgi:hypothetical protein